MKNKKAIVYFRVPPSVSRPYDLIVWFIVLIITLQCRRCSHLFMQHDDYGCKHSACSCRVSQCQIMHNSYDPASLKVDNVPSPLDIRAWSFTKEYPTIPPKVLFDSVAKSLQDTPFFKVWKVDNEDRYIEMTTHSIRLNPGVDYHQVQADVKVLEGKNPSSSFIIIRITPTLIGVISLYEMFTNIDVNDKFAKYIANLIFGAVEEDNRRF